MAWLNTEQRINCLLWNIGDLREENSQCRAKINKNKREIKKMRQMIEELKAEEQKDGLQGN